jgi:hypothetical protein
VIKVKFLRCTTDRTPSTIAFPDFKLHGRRDQSAALGIHMYRLREVFLSFDGDQLELAHHAKLVSLNPRIDEVKNTVV